MPDARQPDFEEECRRQSNIVARADVTDIDLDVLLDAAFADLDDED